jgi:hypothetical protein
MSQYRIDERDCPHPDFALSFWDKFDGRPKSWRGEDAKPVTLSVNAVSVVVIK